MQCIVLIGCGNFAHPNFSDKNDMVTSPKLLDQLRDKLRVKHYAIRTKQSYVDWIKRYIYFHGKTHPKDLAVQDVEAFLTHLAVAGKVSASTKNQAKSALLFYTARCWKSNYRGWITSHKPKPQKNYPSS